MTKDKFKELRHLARKSGWGKSITVGTVRWHVCRLGVRRLDRDGCVNLPLGGKLALGLAYAAHSRRHGFKTTAFVDRVRETRLHRAG